MHENSGFIQQLHRLALAMGFAILVVAPAGHAEQLFIEDLRLKTADTPRLLLEQDTTAFLPPQTWVVDGNEVSFAITDATAGPTSFSIFGGAPTNSLVVAADGRVGIGTDAPDGNLHIFGPANQDVFSGIGPDPGPATGTGFNFGYSGSSFGVGSGFFNIRNTPGTVAPNPSLRFATANAQRMIIDNQGNVGIGLVGTNPIPSQKLDVNGNVRASGVFISGATTLNVPDYVFEPDYKLMPLKQLAAYVAQERHLPEIPSAREIKANGVNLSELQMQLLKKIEELTLYTLQQEKTNQAQQQMIEKLQAQTKLMQAQAKMIEELQARLATLEREQGK